MKKASSPFSRVTRTAEDLAKRIQYWPEDDIARWLKDVAIGGMGFAPQTNLGEPMSSEASTVLHALLLRKDDQGLKAFQSHFPMANEDSMNDWKVALETCSVHYENMAEGEYGTRDDRAHTALKDSWEMARSRHHWALKSVMGLEYQLHCAQKKNSPKTYVVSDDFLSKRIIYMVGRQLNVDADRVVSLKKSLIQQPNFKSATSVEDQERAFLTTLELGERAVNYAAKLFNVLSPTLSFFDAPCGLPYTEKPSSFSSKKDVGSWISAAIKLDHIPLFESLLTKAKLLPEEGCNALLPQWLDLASEVGAVSVLNHLVKNTAVFDLPAPWPHSNEAPTSLAQHIEKRIGHASVGQAWHPEAVSWFKAYFRQRGLEAVPSTGVPASPRTRRRP